MWFKDNRKLVSVPGAIDYELWQASQAWIHPGKISRPVANCDCKTLQLTRIPNIP